jgi:DNA invertase Pin-like site-specific DNA recombinase
MPELNTLPKGIFASLAQHERELISNRTQQALAAKRARGEKLGTSLNLSADGVEPNDERNSKKMPTHKANVQSQHLIHLLRKKGLSVRQIAHVLNEKGYRTRRGCAFTSNGGQILVERSA